MYAGIFGYLFKMVAFSYRLAEVCGSMRPSGSDEEKLWPSLSLKLPIPELYGDSQLGAM